MNYRTIINNIIDNAIQLMSDANYDISKVSENDKDFIRSCIIIKEEKSRSKSKLATPAQTLR